MACSGSRFIDFGEEQGCSSQGVRAGWDDGGGALQQRGGGVSSLRAGSALAVDEQASVGFPLTAANTPLKCPLKQPGSLGAGMTNVGNLSVGSSLIGALLLHSRHFIHLFIINSRPLLMFSSVVLPGDDNSCGCQSDPCPPLRCYCGTSRAWRKQRSSHLTIPAPDCKG